MNGEEAGLHFDVTSEVPRLIGRNALGTRVRDRRMSREHAEISCRGGVWLLHDLGSRNGTFLNRERLAKFGRLRTGDLIQCGRTRLQVGWIEGETSASASSPSAGQAGAAGSAAAASEDSSITLAGGAKSKPAEQAEAPGVAEAPVTPPAAGQPGPEDPPAAEVALEKPGEVDVWGAVVEDEGRDRTSQVSPAKRRKRPAEPGEAGGFDDEAFEEAFGLSENREWDVLAEDSAAGEPTPGEASEADADPPEAGSAGFGLAVTLGADSAPPVDAGAAEAHRFEPEDVSELDAAAQASAPPEPEAEEEWDVGPPPADAADEAPAGEDPEESFEIEASPTLEEPEVEPEPEVAISDEPGVTDEPGPPPSFQFDAPDDPDTDDPDTHDPDTDEHDFAEGAPPAAAAADREKVDPSLFEGKKDVPPVVFLLAGALAGAALLGGGWAVSQSSWFAGEPTAGDLALLAPAGDASDLTPTPAPTTPGPSPTEPAPTRAEQPDPGDQGATAAAAGPPAALAAESAGPVERIRRPAPPAPAEQALESSPSVSASLSSASPAASQSPQPQPLPPPPPILDSPVGSGVAATPAREPGAVSPFDDGPTFALLPRSQPGPAPAERLGSAAELRAIIDAAQGRSLPEEGAAAAAAPAPAAEVAAEVDVLASALETSPSAERTPLDVPVPPLFAGQQPGGESADAASPPSAQPLLPGVAEATAGGGDVAFLVDASGSMVDSLPQVRRWLAQALTELDETRRFNLVKLGHAGPEPCFEAPRAADRAALREALTWVEGELETPFGRSDPREGVGLLSAWAPIRAVFLADDTFGGRQAAGEVEEAAEALVAAAGAGVELFAVEFNYEAPRGLLATLGRGERGGYVFVKPINNLDPDFDASILLP